MKVCGTNKQYNQNFNGLMFNVGGKIVTKEKNLPAFNTCKKLLCDILTDHVDLQKSRDCAAGFEDAINQVSKTNPGADRANLVVYMPRENTIDARQVKLSIVLPKISDEAAVEKLKKSNLVNHFNYYNSVNVPLNKDELLHNFKQMSEITSKLNEVV